MAIYLTDTWARIISQVSTWYLYLKVSRIPKVFMSKTEYTVLFPNLSARSSSANGGNVYQIV